MKPVKSLEIQNFRLFKVLRVDRLERVNLVVGRNNVGKTTLLDAFFLYAWHGHPAAIWHILASHGEIRVPPPPLVRRELDLVVSLADKETREALLEGWRALFPVEQQDREEIRLWIRGNEEDEVTIVWQETARKALWKDRALFDWKPGGELFLSVPSSQFQNGFPAIYVPARGLKPEEILLLWDRIQLTEKEEHIYEILRFLDPRLERVSLRLAPDTSTGQVIVRLKGWQAPVPLAALGGGLNRLFEISLAVVNASGGLCLIDEVENGLHYTAHEDVWRLLYKAAERYDVQIVATTHSFDMIRAFYTFERAVSRRLIALRFSETGEVIALPYDEEALAAVVEHHIEAR